MILNFLIKFVTSKVAEKLIAVAISKLIKSQKSGISKDLATTMINGIAESKLNPTTDKVFEEVLDTLK